MTKQQGFTLIELVIVIIILGVLAATAIPRFVDLQEEARAAAMKGVKGALQGAVSLTYSRAALDGIEGDATGTANGVAIVYGYPAATQAALTEAAGLSITDWTVDESVIGTAYITEAGQKPGADSSCKVIYTEATSTSRPKIVVDDSDC